jgi:hypothetical protein
MNNGQQPERFPPPDRLEKIRADKAEPIGPAKFARRRITGRPPNLAALAEQIQDEVGHIESALRTSLEHARRCGELLTQAHEQCQREQKPWEAWVESNTGLSKTCASNYRRIFREWDRIKSANLADLGVSGALKLLAKLPDHEVYVDVTKPAEEETRVVDVRVLRGGDEGVPPVQEVHVEHLTEAEAADAARDLGVRLPGGVDAPEPAMRQQSFADCTPDVEEVARWLVHKLAHFLGAGDEDVPKIRGLLKEARELPVGQQLALLDHFVSLRRRLTKLENEFRRCLNMPVVVGGTQP